MIHSDYLMIRRAVIFQPGILTGYFDGPLDGLGTAVGKEYPFQAAGFCQIGSGFSHRLRIIQVGNMDQLIDLILERLIILRHIIAQGHDRDTGGKIQIFLTFYIV